MSVEIYPSALEITRENYLAQRLLLEKDIRRLGQEAIDWKGLNPKSVLTIGSHLLHITGFESMVRVTVSGGNVSDLANDPTWRLRYESGFPRELSVEPPDGNPIEYYLDMLSDEARQTKALMQDAKSGHLSLSNPSYFYEVGSEIFVDDNIKAFHPVRLLSRIPIHEDEHRGIINNQRYNYLTLH